MSIEVVNEVIMPLLGTAAVWLVRRIAGSLKVIQELPRKLEETTERIEKKHDERFSRLEQSQQDLGKHQQILTEQIAIALDKLAETPRKGLGD